MGDFEGRHAVVTGGAGALGSAVVSRLLDAGAVVHVPCRDDAEFDRFHAKNHERCHAVAGVDLRDESAVAAYYGGTAPTGERGLWASIHVAGGFAMAPAADTSAADFTGQFELNALTCFLCCREARKRMNGTDPGAEGGRIVNVAARPAVEAAAGMIAYATAKSAVAAITRHLAEEWKDDGVLVNAVLPSIMDTPANREAMPNADFDAWPTLGQVAEAIVWLASPANALTSGALLPIFGRA